MKDFFPGAGLNLLAEEISALLLVGSIDAVRIGFAGSVYLNDS